MQLHRKVKAVGIVGALTTVIVGVFQRLHVDLTPAEATAFATVLVTIAGYRTRS